MGGKNSGRPPRQEFIPAEGIDPWERQPKESAKAFAAFAAYRDLGPDRTVAKAVTILGKKTGYRRAMEEWSVRWGWVARASLWDDHQDRFERDAALVIAEQTIREKVAVADGLWKTAAKGLLMWNKYLDQTSQQQTASGVFEQPPISPGDVYRLADAGLKLSQLLEGKPTDIQEQRKQITIEERRKGIQQHLGNPKLRAAMREVALAMENSPNPDGGGNGSGGSIH